MGASISQLMPVILLVAVPLGLCFAPALRRGGLLGATLLVFVAGVCFGPYWWSMETQPIPLSVDRVLWVVLMAVALFAYRFRRDSSPRLDTAEGVLLALLGWLLVVGIIRGDGGDPAAAVARWLFYYAMPAGLYFAARQSRVDQSTSYRAGWGLVGFGVYLALVALAEVTDLHQVVFPRYIASPEYAEFFGRARGPLLNPIGNGVLLSFAWLGAIALWPHCARRCRLSLAAIHAILLAALFATLTRSVWLGVAAVAVTVAAVLAGRRARAVLLLAGCAGVLAVGLGWHESLLSFKRDRNLSAEAARESVELRPILAAVALRMFADHPVTGVGLAGYDEAKLAYLADRNSAYPLSRAKPYTQHNVFLSLLVESGLVGLGLFVLFLSLSAREAWFLWRRRSADWCYRLWGLIALGVIAVYVVNGLFHDVSIIPMLNAALLLAAGLCRAARHNAAAEAAAVWVSGRCPLQRQPAAPSPAGI